MRKTLIALIASMIATSEGPFAASTGSLSGRVLPVADRPSATRVWIAPSGSTERPLASPVLADGSFAIADVPAGTVGLAVETSEGLYAVHAPITIAPGTTRTLQLALGGRQDTSPVPPATEPKEKQKQKAASVWANPLYATLIVVGSALVIGVLISELTQPSDRPASPSTSTQ
jgi:hypothetical protein